MLLVTKLMTQCTTTMHWYNCFTTLNFQENTFPEHNLFNFMRDWCAPHLSDKLGEKPVLHSGKYNIKGQKTSCLRSVHLVYCSELYLSIMVFQSVGHN